MESMNGSEYNAHTEAESAHFQLSNFHYKIESNHCCSKVSYVILSSISANVQLEVSSKKEKWSLPETVI